MEWDVRRPPWVHHHLVSDMEPTPLYFSPKEWESFHQYLATRLHETKQNKHGQNLAPISTSHDGVGCEATTMGPPSPREPLCECTIGNSLALCSIWRGKLHQLATWLSGGSNSRSWSTFVSQLNTSTTPRSAVGVGPSHDHLVQGGWRQRSRHQGQAQCCSRGRRGVKGSPAKATMGSGTKAPCEGIIHLFKGIQSPVQQSHFE
jgi:hypothetical protein